MSPVRQSPEPTPTIQELLTRIEALERQKLRGVEVPLRFPGGSKATEQLTTTIPGITTISSVVAVYSRDFVVGVSLITVAGNKVTIQGYDFNDPEEPPAGAEVLAVVFVIGE